MINLIKHPIAKNSLSFLRAKNTNIKEFREHSKILTTFIAIEATKNLIIIEKKISTPFEEIKTDFLNTDVVLLPILRAGLSMVDSFLKLLPEARIGYVGVKRNEDSLQPEEYYYKIPEIYDNTIVIILEPMIATGGTICQTLGKLLLDDITNVKIASILSAPEGVERILSEFPNIDITTASLDRELNNKGYIIPGLGDAGDRYTGY